MRAIMTVLIALAALLGNAAAARDLPVPADKGWRHTKTGVVLRVTMLGLPVRR